MDYALSNTLVWIGTYTAWLVWSFLGLVLVIALLRKNFPLAIRMIKYLLNSSVFFVGEGIILELALAVRPPISATKETSITDLQSLIKHHQLNDVYVSVIVIFILFLINLLFYYKFEKRRNKKDIAILAIVSAFILGFSIWLNGQYAFFGLMQEINRHFGS
jgi:formate-dependent nitrite reductase membrane component NrfD